jgi:tetratricopeptide (TPR) repeat protein
VLNFWAPWCAGCARELPALARLASRFGGQARFAGVTVERNDLDSVRKAAAGAGIAYPQYLSAANILESFFGKSGEAPLPATFVFDAAGGLRRAFLREVGEDELGVLVESLVDSEAFADDLAVRGVVAFEKGKAAEAADWFRRAVAARPDFARYQNNLGVALGALGDHAAAALALEQAAALDPDDANVWFNLGVARREAGEARSALKALDRAIAANPRAAAPHVQKARAHVRLNQLREARASLETALAIDPGNADAWGDLRALGDPRGK